jgi:hypothetical protein
VPRPADHAGLQLEVQPGGHQRVVEARHHDDLVHERVVRTPPPAQFLAQRALLILGHVLDDQHLEVGPAGVGPFVRVRLATVGLILGSRVPGRATVVGVGGQGPVEPGHHRRAPVVLAGREEPPDLLEGVRAGKRPVPLDGPEQVKRFGDRLGQLVDGTSLAERQGELRG